MRLILVLFWLIPCFSLAQITLSSPGLAAVLNSRIVVRAVDSTYLAALDLQTTGGGQVWDISDVRGIGRFDTLYFFVPEETPWSSNFPGANLASLTEPQNPMAAASYFLLTDTSLAFLGYQDTVSRAVPLEPDRRLTFPFSAGSTIDQTFPIFRDLQAFTDTGTVAQQISVDAWGELILPLGRFNCLRLKRTREEQFQVFGLPIQIKNTIYEFWAEGYVLPLLTIDFQQSFLFGGVDESLTGQYLVDRSILNANRRLRPDTYHLQLFPNPTSGRLELNYALEENTPLQLEVYDSAGRLLRRLDLGRQAAGAHQYSLVLKDLSPGVYQLVLRGRSGTAARPVIME